MSETSIAALPSPVARLKIPGGDFIRGAVNMPVVRQVTLLIALAGTVALGLFAALWMRDDDMKPVAGISSPTQAAELGQLLEAARIPYQLDHKTSTLLVR